MFLITILLHYASIDSHVGIEIVVCKRNTLAETEVKFSGKHACCVILASDGYPVSYKKGFPIDIPSDVLPCTYVAGAKKDMGQLVTSGGRVLGVTAVEDSLAEAIESAYAMAERVSFEGAYMRHDIGARALKAVQK